MATIPVRLAPGFPDIRDYPQSGNRTMPSTQHERAQRTAAMLLEAVVAPDDIVAVELMILLDAGHLRRHLTPDVFVARGVGELDPIYDVPRQQYRLWDEGKVPDLVYEGASPSTKNRDSAGKKDDYAALGVREYVQFDPLGTLLFPRLQVHRLTAFGGYERVAAEDDGAVRCVTFPDYEWLIEGYLLRLRDRATGRLVPTPSERAVMATARADTEAERARSEAMRAERENMRADTEAARAEAEATRAERERIRAATETARADSAEAELTELRAQLARLQADRDLSQ
jgi:Uma2 family endonuclease